jgi:hypothetical protein
MSPGRFPENRGVKGGKDEVQLIEKDQIDEGK